MDARHTEYVRIINPPLPPSPLPVHSRRSRNSSNSSNIPERGEREQRVHLIHRAVRVNLTMRPIIYSPSFVFRSSAVHFSYTL